MEGTAAGGEPAWRGDGEELYFLQGRSMMAVTVGGGAEPIVGIPQKLLHFDHEVSDVFAVSRDGSRFVIMQESQAESISGLKVIQNFHQLLTKKFLWPWHMIELERLCGNLGPGTLRVPGASFDNLGTRLCVEVSKARFMMSVTEQPTLPRRGLDLARLIRRAVDQDIVRRDDLDPGDWLMVTTKNSRYVVGHSGSGRLVVSGGWFDQTGESPADVEILGCTFGGRAIWTEVLAAPGLFLEFDNGVRTTRIQEVRTFRSAPDETVC